MLSILTTLDGSEESLAVIPALEKMTQGQTVSITLFAVEHEPSGTPRRSTIARSPTSPAGGVPGSPIDLSSPSSARSREPQWAESEEQATERVLDEAKDWLEAAAKPLRDKGLQVETDAVVGRNISEAIADYARNHNVDMIAMSTHGRSGLSGLVQGSVAADVVRTGVAPVLLVRPTK